MSTGHFLTLPPARPPFRAPPGISKTGNTKWCFPFLTEKWFGSFFSWREYSHASFQKSAVCHRFSMSNTLRFHSHPYGMRLKSEGLSHGLRKYPPDTFLPCLRQGRPFESRPKYQKRETPNGVPRFWYAGRDSNPQPSEPESDALSIEPPSHFSKPNYYSRLSRFCKEEN